MNRRFAPLFLASLTATLLVACQAHTAGSAAFQEIQVDKAAELQKSGAMFFDANGDDFRQENGVVPGAVLLDSSSKYALTVLPADKDKPLVFYCANTL